MPRVIQLLWRAHPFAAGLIPILTLIAAPLSAFSLYCSKKIIDGVTLLLQGDRSGGREMLTLFLCLMFGARLLQGTLDILIRFLDRVLRTRLTHYIQTKITNLAVRLDMAFFETPSFYDKLQRAQREAGTRPFMILSSSVSSVRQLVELLGYLALLATLAWWVSPLLLLLTIPGLFVDVRFGRRTWFVRYGRTQQERQMSYYQSLLTSNYAAKELRLFGLAAYFISRWKELFWQFYRQDRRLAIKHNLAELGAFILNTLGFVGFYVFVLYRTVTDPVVTIGSMIMYTRAMGASLGAMRGGLQAISALYENNLYLKQLFEYLSLRPQILAPTVPVPVPAPIRRGIRFESVSFRYPGSSRNVLENITFEVGPGERIALVGENGAGKTTLIKLLTRLYDPQQGRITVDGIDLRELAPEAWRQQIGVIFQDFVHYLVTARENVGFGQLDHVNDMSRIRMAADLSGAKECIERLDHGWETILGKLFDEGQELSVGEWQKVALARAFQRDAQILVLDEPTASLDAKQEYMIYKKFDELTRDKTTILISHRFSTVRMVDRILVMEAGRIVESGSHEELIALNDRYTELFNRQASAYR